MTDHRTATQLHRHDRFGLNDAGKAYPGVDSEMQDTILGCAEVKAVCWLVQLAEAGHLPDHNAAIGTAVNLLNHSHLYAFSGIRFCGFACA